MKRFKYTNLAWFCALISASLPLISYAVVFGATDQLDRIFESLCARKTVRWCRTKSKYQK